MKNKNVVPPLVDNTYYEVYFGTSKIGFSKVSNVRHEVEHEALMEGGLNGFVHILNKPSSKGDVLTLEKGVIGTDASAEIIQRLAPGVRITVPVIINLCKRGKGKWLPVRSWSFMDGVVTKWELNDLNALGSEVAVDRLEITHSGLMELGV